VVVCPLRLSKCGVERVTTSCSRICASFWEDTCGRIPIWDNSLPESNPLRKRETDRRNALVMQVIKEAAETEENVAWRTDWRK
uniref:Ubiquinol-cytochrome-c reductase complex assembly factor 3 n=1 Tax=Callorhinchus milii TaxID=7868 RepID=A0A4W3GKR5_CALMI